MSSIPSVSLTDLNRSVSSLQAALEDHPLALLTRYNKPAYAVLPLTVDAPVAANRRAGGAPAAAAGRAATE